MAKHLRRQLRKDEDIHHRDHNKLNFNLSNLELLDHTKHGWVSAKQHWFMKNRLASLEALWEQEYNDNAETSFNPEGFDND
jgi:hypothetical protein